MALDAQSAPALSDQGFALPMWQFHPRPLVDAGGQPGNCLNQLAGAVEAMQPLMNMITFNGVVPRCIVRASPRRSPPQ